MAGLPTASVPTECDLSRLDFASSTANLSTPVGAGIGAGLKLDRVCRAADVEVSDFLSDFSTPRSYPWLPCVERTALPAGLAGRGLDRVVKQNDSDAFAG